MEIGIFSRTYEHMPLEAVFREMDRQGIHHTQFNLSSAGLPTLPESVNEEALLAIPALAKKYGITLDALSGTFNMIDPDEDARSRGCRQFETQCRIARLLEIPIVTLCTGSKHPKDKWAWHEDNRKEAAWSDLMRSTEKILTFAQDNGITLGVETEASNIICSPEKARRYLDDVGSPNLKIIMDGGEPVPAGAGAPDGGNSGGSFRRPGKRHCSGPCQGFFPAGGHFLRGCRRGRAGLSPLYPAFEAVGLQWSPGASRACPVPD